MPETSHAARTVLDHWRRGDVFESFNASQCPDSIADGYAIQAMLSAQRNEPVLGWKIAATSAAGRAHINVEHPLAGRLYQSIVLSDGDQIDISANRMGVAEAEIVLVVDRDLPPKSSSYTQDEIAIAISEVRPGLEIPDSRFTDFTKAGAASLIADNACAQYFVLGEPATTTFDAGELADHPTRLLVNDRVVTSGTGNDALGGPLPALTWLVNTLNTHGLTLHAGQFVTTGVTGAPSPICVGDTVCTDLGVLGSVCATIG